MNSYEDHVASQISTNVGYVLISEYMYVYCIMQMVCSRKLSQLQRLVEVCGKTFAVVSVMQYFFV